MKKNTAISWLSMGAAIFVSASSTVSAADVTQTLSYSGSDSFSSTLSFAPFNTALGTLDGITLTLDSTETVSVEVINIYSSPLSFTDATASFPIIANALNGLSASVTGSAGPISGIASTYPPANGFSGGTENLNISTAVPSADFSLYEGGSYDITVGSGPGTYAGTPGIGLPVEFFGGSVTASGDVKIDYNYTPSSVPDSANSIWLVGGVCFSLIAASKKLRSRAA
jgi:hypothetical protein